MPKKVTLAQIREWRGLLGEGKNYREIAEKTRWQVRTVRKYLESDIKSSEVAEIRRELFKERLGRHWDMLIDGVLRPLGSVTALRPGEGLEWISSSGPAETSLAGAVIQRDEKWNLTAAVEASKAIEWSLLREHMPKDPLWTLTSSWEEVLKRDLLARRKLYIAVEKDLVARTKLQVSDDPAEEKPALKPACVRLVFVEAFGRALGQPPQEVTGRGAPEGRVWALATYVAFAPGSQDRALEAVKEAPGRWAKSAEAAGAREICLRLREQTGQLERTIAHLRLLPYLPGVCSVCGRFEV